MSQRHSYRNDRRLDPFEGSLLPGVDVSIEQEEDEYEHRQEPVPPERVERDGPGEDENGLDVENDKEHGDHVEPWGEARPDRRYIRHTAFVRIALRLVRSGGADNEIETKE